MTEQSREDQLETRIRQLEQRLERRESSPVSGAANGARDAMAGASEAFWALVHRVFPEDARRHMRAATREQLLAARAYLDRWIESLDGEREEPAAVIHERIEVE